MMHNTVKHRSAMYNALIKPKPEDIGNILYNYACDNDLNELITHINGFSPCEIYNVALKLEETCKLVDSTEMRNGWGETKTEILDEINPDAELRNRLIDHLYFSQDELENIDKRLEQFKIYLHLCTQKDRDIWFKQRAPIFQTILRNFNGFSHVELIVLYGFLEKKEMSLLLY